MAFQASFAFAATRAALPASQKFPALWLKFPPTAPCCSFTCPGSAVAGPEKTAVLRDPSAPGGYYDPALPLGAGCRK